MDTNIATLMKTLQLGYYHLGILPVTPEVDEERLANRIAQKCGGNSLNVGLTLSERLMEVSSSQRVVRAYSELQALLPTESYVVLYHLPILFHPELQLNVFRLLLQMSRGVPIIVLLPCRYDARWVWYAEPGHPEYQRHAREDLYIIKE